MKQITNTNRRRFIGCSLCALFTWKNALTKNIVNNGCIISNDEVYRLLNNHNTFTFSSKKIKTVPVSGDQYFDRALGRQLVRLANTFNVEPSFTYAYNFMNASASTYTTIKGTKGSVFFGLDYLKKIMSLGMGGDITVLGICAHEFAHIHQFFGSINYSFLKKYPTSKLTELHADLIAGYFIQYIKSIRPNINTHTFVKFMTSIGSYRYWLANFHGTPSERSLAVKTGMKLWENSITFEEAAWHGAKIILKKFK